MRSYLGIALSLGIASALLTGCGKKAADDATNIVEMNASDGTMNDMTVVESATLDQAGGDQPDGNAAGNETKDASDAGNGM
jgi:hypothetical protein